jgi:hypothetical protein
MPHAEEEKKDSMFRPIGEAVEAVDDESGNDEPQVMDNIGEYFRLLALFSTILIYGRVAVYELS